MTGKHPAKHRPKKPEIKAKAVAKKSKPSIAKAPATVAETPAPAPASPSPSLESAPPHHSSPAEVLGDVVWLMTQSPAHRHFFVADLDWLILPPLMLRQCRLVRGKERPQSFVTWALLNEEVEQRLMAGHNRLKPSDWNSGDRAWMIDLIAPFGGQDALLVELKQRLFPDRPLKLLQPGKDGKGPVAGEVRIQPKEGT
ncbi:MAG: toxin-activating lysine-acyltransferase [Alphaproteobacteria bacterium]|nr:toxin-activating lysine-acyltransferase [Alphaproteobacteria bacterium]